MFSTIVGPFLSTSIAIAASIVLLLFIGLFASGFSLFVLKDEKFANLPIVSTMILTVIATALGLLSFLDIQFSDTYQRFGMHLIVSLSILGMTLLLMRRFDSADVQIPSVVSGLQNNMQPESIARLMANDRIKDEHISMVAHELRTPLGE